MEDNDITELTRKTMLITSLWHCMRYSGWWRNIFSLKPNVFYHSLFCICHVMHLHFSSPQIIRTYLVDFELICHRRIYRICSANYIYSLFYLKNCQTPLRIRFIQSVHLYVYLFRLTYSFQRFFLLLLLQSLSCIVFFVQIMFRIFMISDFVIFFFFNIILLTNANKLYIKNKSKMKFLLWSWWKYFQDWINNHQKDKWMNVSISTPMKIVVWNRMNSLWRIRMPAFFEKQNLLYVQWPNGLVSLCFIGKWSRLFLLCLET